MKAIKTKRTTPDIFSAKINLTAPESWEELSQKQLKYVLWLLSNDYTVAETKTLMFVRFTGIRIIRKTAEEWLCRKGKQGFLLKMWEAGSFVSRFKYVEEAEKCNNRIEKAGRLKAADVDFHGVRFIDYLTLENLYQSFIMSKKKDGTTLEYMCRIMYFDKNGNNNKEGAIFSSEEKLGAFLWYTYVKSMFAKNFTYLFAPSGSAGANGWNPTKSMNTQIRALTGGDITKENIVFQQDCWRALTELDEKARESAEMERKMKS